MVKHYLELIFTMNSKPNSKPTRGQQLLSVVIWNTDSFLNKIKLLLLILNLKDYERYIYVFEYKKK